MRTSICVFFALMAFCGSALQNHGTAASISAQRLYWANDGGRITSILPSGGDRQMFLGLNYQTPTPQHVEIDSLASTIYWTDIRDSAIRRANIDGSNTEVIYQGTNDAEPGHLALDLVNKKLYWSSSVFSRDIQRSNLDGTSVEVVYDGIFGSDPRFLSVDPVNQKLYWTDAAQNVIFQSNLDGTARVPLIDVTRRGLNGLAIDSVSNKLYWTSFGAIQRSDLDGTSIETVISLGSGVHPIGITVDPFARQMYWIDINQRAIFKANLDGTMLKLISTANDRVALARNLALSYNIPEPTALTLLCLGLVPLLRRR